MTGSEHGDTPTDIVASLRRLAQSPRLPNGNAPSAASTSAFDAPPSPTTAPSSPSATTTTTTATPAPTPDSPHTARLRKRASLLRDLLLSLDSLILVNLAATYYLDTLSLLFLFRTLVQRAMQLTAFAPLPHIPAALAPMLAAALARQSGSTAPQLGLLIATTILAMTIHLFAPVASAGEATRGYLHGGLFIDFVGQKAAGPLLSRIRLLALDFLSGGLQLVMVCVLRECRRCEVAAEALGGVAASSRGEGLLEALVEGRQRRMRRPSRGQPGETADGIEMDELRPRPQTKEDHEAEARRPMLEAVEKTRDNEEEHPLDELNSGQVIITTLHVLDTIRNCFLDWKAERRLGTV